MTALKTAMLQCPVTNIFKVTLTKLTDQFDYLALNHLLVMFIHKLPSNHVLNHVLYPTLRASAQTNLELFSRIQRGNLTRVRSLYLPSNE